MFLASPVDLSPLLKTPGTVSPEDVLHFRREVFRDGLVSKQEADAVFMINDATEAQCSQWHDFYVEVMSDFVVAQMEPRGYVSVDNGEWLIRQVNRDGQIKSPSELEMLIQIVEKATEVPKKMTHHILQHVSHAVISGEGELIRGQKLSKGVMGEAETELLRRVLYAMSGCDGSAVSRQEAEILFDLNDKTTEQENHPSWNLLFVKAIANYLMAVSGYQPPSRQTAFAREKWMNDTEINIAETLKQSLSSFGTLFSGTGFKDMFQSAGDQIEQAWQEKNTKFEQAAQTAEVIDEQESHWLVERIGRDGKFHENEKALIEFLKEDSPNIHPSLKPLVNMVA